jgi:diaminopimelate epimerase
MQFTKYEGLGNDFIVVDADPTAIDADQARHLCDRHFGIGADGVLLVSPTPSAAAQMVVINADGSRPEMCGNGLRCVALHLAGAGAVGNHFDVLTDAGALRCDVQTRGAQHWITIGLGKASSLAPLSTSFDGQSFEFARISIGNPHAITFGPVPPDELVDRLGPEVSASISGGANVEFTEQIAPTHLKVVVWERGVGRTLACGTGAGAVAAAAALAGRSPYERPITVELPGGALEISVRERDLDVQLCGPARRVFRGEVELR